MLSVALDDSECHIKCPTSFLVCSLKFLEYEFLLIQCRLLWPFTNEGYLYIPIMHNTSIPSPAADDATIITGIETTPLVVREREQPQFTCIAEGRPTPNMAWFFNGVEAHSGDSSGQFVIRNETRGTRVMSTFSVVQSFAQHSGIVSCEAWNRPETVNVTFNDASSTTLTVLSECSNCRPFC